MLRSVRSALQEVSASADRWRCRLLTRIVVSARFRGASFKEDEGTWKGNEDGKVVNNQPQRVMDDRNGIGPTGGYIAK